MRVSPITYNTHLVSQYVSTNKVSVPKILLGCYVKKIHNGLIDTYANGGLSSARDTVTRDVLISDTSLH